ncbi:Glutamate--cysteine ligase catalytic subunit [Thelohanellus kitauei]|uniref:Glutamate--cysteine ligase n=1 Tax=Thelohanellus kitauei TaxID=669202 RepID=A0A0C2JW84_THEKT|nr:Glutamate--cysteine ligase catalytic subunit [Thelohanellus kitauei]
MNGLREGSQLRIQAWYLINVRADYAVNSRLVIEMGLLSTGTSLTWEEIENWAEFVKEHGIIQFINIYNSLKDRKNDLLKYGDEVSLALFSYAYSAFTCSIP